MKRLLFVNFIVLILLSGCSKEGSISLGTTDQIGIDQIDSFTVSSSTIKFDSIPTSGNSRLLTGAVNNTFSGKVRANTFFQIDLASISTPEQKDLVFDSINLVLRLDKYYYGDTTKQQVLYLHQLTDNIELKEIPSYLDDDEKPIFVSSEALYNISKTGYEASPLAVKQYLPKPNRQDSLTFTLPKEMGETWLNYILLKDSKFSNSEEFLQYFKGLALISDENNQNMIGFSADTLSLNLYYSYLNENTGIRTQSKISFSANSSLRYNQIEPLGYNNALSYLANMKNSISSSSTLDATFVQSGLGLATKINLPFLNYFYESNSEYAINHAELRIPVEYDESNKYTLPEKLILFLANKNNVPQSYIYGFNSTSEIQYGSLVKKVEAYDRYYYSFNLTSSMKSIRNSERTGGSLLLSYPTDKLFNTLENVAILNKNLNKIKLIITYTKF